MLLTVRTTSIVTVSLAFIRVCSAYPAGVEGISARQIAPNHLNPVYDYVVVGGGQAGLTVASRLSEDRNKTVLVVELSTLATDPAQEDPMSAFDWKPWYLFNVTSIPLPGLNGRKDGKILAATVVGGGSTVNAMMYDRGAPQNYENWAKLSNPGWGWKDLLPYFKKNTQLAPPAREVAEEFGITYDLAAYGTETSPIHASYPTFQFPGVKRQIRGFEQTGLVKQKEGALNAVGVFWFPGALDVKTVKRSYAVNAFYEPVESRSNLHLLTQTRVNEVLFDKAKHVSAVNIQPINGKQVITVKVKREVVMAAGSLHTPQILQRSGVGPAAVLREAKIPVVVDLPGVGANFQDHTTFFHNYTFKTDVTPNQGSWTNNASFVAWATELWNANRTGPYSFAAANVGAWIPLPLLAPDWKDIVRTIKSQNPAQYLPQGYDSTLIKGYKAQLDLLASSFAGNGTGLIEIPLDGSGYHLMAFEHPLSRGTIRVDPKNRYGAPILNTNTYANPIDALIVARAFQWVRKWMATPAMREFTPVELSPGLHVQSDKDMINYVRDVSAASMGHGCCTAAMAPRSLGGVVSPDLLVYGVKGLSVADNSIPPLQIGSHTCETVYAIARKAVELIRARNAH